MSVSPYNYFQERYRHDPWKMLCCTIMLNMTSGKQLEQVHIEFFSRFSTPAEYIDVYSAFPEKVEMLIKPLGMQKIRAARIAKFSQEFLKKDWQRPIELYGIGKYGQDSYDIFILNDLSVDAKDKELRRYLEWARLSIL